MLENLVSEAVSFSVRLRHKDLSLNAGVFVRRFQLNRRRGVRNGIQHGIGDAPGGGNGVPHLHQMNAQRLSGVGERIIEPVFILRGRLSAAGNGEGADHVAVAGIRFLIGVGQALFRQRVLRFISRSVLHIVPGQTGEDADVAAEGLLDGDAIRPVLVRGCVQIEHLRHIGRAAQHECDPVRNLVQQRAELAELIVRCGENALARFHRIHLPVLFDVQIDRIERVRDLHVRLRVAARIRGVIFTAGGGGAAVDLVVRLGQRLHNIIFVCLAIRGVGGQARRIIGHEGGDPAVVVLSVHLPVNRAVQLDGRVAALHLSIEGKAHGRAVRLLLLIHIHLRTGVLCISGVAAPDLGGFKDSLFGRVFVVEFCRVCLAIYQLTGIVHIRRILRHRRNRVSRNRYLVNLIGIRLPVRGIAGEGVPVGACARLGLGVDESDSFGARCGSNRAGADLLLKSLDERRADVLLQYERHFRIRVLSVHAGDVCRPVPGLFCLERHIGAADIGVARDHAVAYRPIDVDPFGQAFRIGFGNAVLVPVAVFVVQRHVREGVGEGGSVHGAGAGQRFHTVVKRGRVIHIALSLKMDGDLGQVGLSPAGNVQPVLAAGLRFRIRHGVDDDARLAVGPVGSHLTRQCIAVSGIAEPGVDLRRILGIGVDRERGRAGYIALHIFRAVGLDNALLDIIDVPFAIGVVQRHAVEFTAPEPVVDLGEPLLVHGCDLVGVRGVSVLIHGRRAVQVERDVRTAAVTGAVVAPQLPCIQRR